MSDESINIPAEAVQGVPALPSIDQMKAMSEQAIKDIDAKIDSLRKRREEISAEIQDLNAKRVDAARILGALTPRTRKPKHHPPVTHSALVAPEEPEEDEGTVAYGEIRCQVCEVGWSLSKTCQETSCWCCGAPGEMGSVRRLLSILSA